MTLDFFTFPIKVGEIIMKNSNPAFMKFTVKDYTTKWQALEIGSDGLCDFPTSFRSGHGTYITRCKQIRRKESWQMNIWHFLLPELLWMTATFSSRSESLPIALLQMYYDLFTWARMKAKPKKNRSLSLVGGSARENHSKLEEVIRSQQSGRSW